MNKLCRKKTGDELRSVSYRIRLTAKEADKIKFSALARNLSVAGFIRRTALGRNADLRYETEIVLQLLSILHAIQKIRIDLVNKKMLPSEIEEWSPIIEQATTAITRITK